MFGGVWGSLAGCQGPVLADHLSAPGPKLTLQWNLLILFLISPSGTRESKLPASILPTDDSSFKNLQSEFERTEKTKCTFSEELPIQMEATPQSLASIYLESGMFG